MPYFGSSPHFGDFPTAKLTGNGGSVYTLPFKLPNENAALVFLNGAPQLPGVHFSIAEGALTFSANVAAGVQIYVHGLGIGKAMITPSAGSVGLAQLLAQVYANASEAQGLSNTIKLLSPAGLRDAFKGANQALSGNGYQKLPGGLIIQWGSTITSAGGTVAVTFPIAFPSAAFSVVGMHLGAGNATVISTALSQTSVTLALGSSGSLGQSPSGSGTIRWIAIGN